MHTGVLLSDGRRTVIPDLDQSQGRGGAGSPLKWRDGPSCPPCSLVLYLLSLFREHHVRTGVWFFIWV